VTGERRLVTSIPSGPLSLERATTQFATSTAHAQRRQRWAAGGVAVITVAVAAALVVAGRASRSRSAAVVSASAPSASAPSPPPTSTADLPSPASTSPDAVAAYRRGLVGERDGEALSARRQFERAVELDPDMTAAWLRLSVIEFFSNSQTESRVAFQKAMASRDRLDEHDRLFADAMEPIIQRSPSDFEEHARRLEAATVRFPMDGEIAGSLAYAYYRLTRYEEALAVFDRLLAIDPAQPDAYRFEAACQASLGRLDDALATMDRCEKANPQSTVCPFGRYAFAEEAGDCAAIEQVGRTIELRDPHSDGAAMLAEGIASQDGPPEAVRDALAREATNLPGDQRPTESKAYDLAYALWLGDFVTAATLAKELEAVLTGQDSEERHVKAAIPIVQIAIETGHPDAARRAAQSYLARHTAWISNGKYTAKGLSRSVVPWMLALRRQAGGSREEMERDRDAFVADWSAHTCTRGSSSAWRAKPRGIGTARAARTRASSRDGARRGPGRSRRRKRSGARRPSAARGDGVRSPGWAVRFRSSRVAR
jgi:tetratricopeptide (TPR) repeat protein